MIKNNIPAEAFAEGFPDWAWRDGLPKSGARVVLGGGFDSMCGRYLGAEKIGGEWRHLAEFGGKVHRFHGYQLREYRD